MYKRDVGIVILACVAMLVALQQEATFSFHKAWYHRTADHVSSSVHEGTSLPPPIVADLNGDGHLEVIVVLPDLKLQVLQPQPPGRRAGDGFAAARVIASLKPFRKLWDFSDAGSGDPEEHWQAQASLPFPPVAMAVGHLDPMPTELVRPPRKQVVVIMTETWEVLCFDHNLKQLWKREPPVEMDWLTSIREVAIHISPNKVLDKDRGMVVVGGSVERGDMPSDYEDSEDYMYDEDADDLDSEAAEKKANAEDRLLMGDEKQEKDKEAHAHSAGEDEELTDVLEKEGGAGRAGLDASRHFSYYAMDGGSGEERWHHSSEDFHKDLQELAAQLQPQHDYKLEAEEVEGRHFGEASCRDYRESLLHVLPHAWADTHDTRLEVAHFVKHREGRGAQKANLADAARTHKGARATASVGHQANPDPRARYDALQQAHKQAGRSRGFLGALFGRGSVPSPHVPKHHAAPPNALVAFLEEGIEVVHLFSGRPICKLHLPPGELHADVNGDGTVDHVQVYRGHLGLQNQGADPTADLASPYHHHAGSHCAMHVTSGIPPMQTLYEANLCRPPLLARASNLKEAGLFGGKSGERGHRGRDSHRHRGASQRELQAEVEKEAAAMAEPAVLTLPAFLPLHRPHDQAGNALSKHMRGGRGGLVVVLSSRGQLTAIDEKGEHAWQETLPLAWHHEGPAASPPTLTPLALHTHGPPTVILAAGASAAVVVSEHGKVLSMMWLPHAPNMPLIAADFNGDGLTDILAVTQDGLYGWAQVQRVGVTTLPAVLLTLIIAMAVLAWGAQQQGPGHISRAVAAGASKAAARRLRSTEYED